MYVCMVAYVCTSIGTVVRMCNIFQFDAVVVVIYRLINKLELGCYRFCIIYDSLKYIHSICKYNTRIRIRGENSQGYETKNE